MQPNPVWHDLITHLDLQPHPEGGFYREVFRSNQTVMVNGQARSASTSIYYLLNQGAYSAWHRIDADETWYFLAGQTLKLYMLAQDGSLTTCLLGHPLVDQGASLQLTVAAGYWFAAEPTPNADYTLVACNVAPGFEFDGFELATPQDLAGAVKRHGKWLKRLLHVSPVSALYPSSP